MALLTWAASPLGKSGCCKLLSSYTCSRPLSPQVWFKNRRAKQTRLQGGTRTRQPGSKARASSLGPGVHRAAPAAVGPGLLDELVLPSPPWFTEDPVQPSGPGFVEDPVLSLGPGSVSYTHLTLPTKIV